jgi:glutathione S-transferase
MWSIRVSIKLGSMLSGFSRVCSVSVISHFILEWLETKHPKPSLLPSIEEADDRLLVKQIEVVVDGICDALVLSFFENQRDEDKRSKPWTDRYVSLVTA